MHRTRLRRTAAITRSGLRKYPRELLDSLRAGQPRTPAACECGPEHWARCFQEHEFAAVWLGHASMLFRIGGRTVLTDPVFSHRVGLRLGPVTFGIPRLSPLPVDPADLPHADIILLSHAHFDHLDRPSLQRLVSRRTAVVTARRTAKLLPHGFGDVVELDWETQTEVLGLKVAALKPVHWGARFAYDRHRGFNSYVLETRVGTDPDRVLYAGDTAKTDAFRGVGPVDLAIFGIGAYEPWIHRHANPEQVWEMFSDVRGGERARLAPIHHSTFKLGEEAVDEPLRRLLGAAGPDERSVVCRSMGELWVHDRPGRTRTGEPVARHPGRGA